MSFLFSYEIISTITTVRNSSAIYDEQLDSKDTLGGDLIFPIKEGLTSKAVNREDKRSRRYRDRDFAKFERSRRYRDR